MTMRGSEFSRTHPDEIALIDGEGDDQRAGAMRNDVAPVGAFGRRERRDGNSEIVGAVGVVADVEKIAMRLDVVAQFRLALRDEARLGSFVAQIDEPAFAGVMAANGDDRETAAAAFLARRRTRRGRAPRRSARRSPDRRRSRGGRPARCDGSRRRGHNRSLRIGAPDDRAVRVASRRRRGPCRRRGRGCGSRKVPSPCRRRSRRAARDRANAPCRRCRRTHGPSPSASPSSRTVSAPPSRGVRQ